MVICKATVRFKRFTPAMLTLLNALYAADQGRMEGQPADLVITSANDAAHLATSKHYTDQALDVRSKTFATEAAKRDFLVSLRAQLGPQFTVLYEDAGTPNEHFHLQVKKGTVFHGRS